MISFRRPAEPSVQRYRDDRLDTEPTCDLGGEPLAGSRQETFSRTVGLGPEAFDRARHGVESWAAHRGAGVDIFPRDAEIHVGETVALVTRQLGLWVLAACRIVALVDQPTTFGFTYATLPDHPECGYESFVVALRDHEVVFEITAVSRPGILLVRLGAPVTRQLQRRAATGYLAAMRRWVDETR